MVKNRAKKAAARRIATDKNVRYPDALAQTDSTVQEFTTGINKIMGSKEVEAGVHLEIYTPAEEPVPGLAIQLPVHPPLILTTGKPGTGRTARGWARIEAADAALDELGVPQEAQRFATSHSGLFLIAGATGTGKTTTGLALMRRARYDIPRDAAAIVDPFDIQLAGRGGAMAYPVEDGIKAATAIREAVADGARVIFAEELRDADAVEAALDAALGGVLVFAAVHSKASNVTDRLLSMFPRGSSKQVQAKIQLALRGVVGQALVRSEGSGPRVPEFEVWSQDENGDLTLSDRPTSTHVPSQQLGAP